MVIILDGRKAADIIMNDVKNRVQTLKSYGITVGLGTILIGDDPASIKYVNGKHADCEKTGITSYRSELPSFASQDEVEAAVRTFNDDTAITGFITQLPLPDGLDANAVINSMNPDKDADGLHPLNLGRLMLDVDGNGGYPMPCTPSGIIRLLEMNHIDLDGADICVIGRGLTAGRPLAAMLTNKHVNASVDICHTGTRDLPEHIAAADIVISCVGKEWFIQPEWINAETVIVDVGVSRILENDGKYHVHGDFHPYCHTVCKAYTPNPGGVGPMTRAMLLDNVVSIAERKLQES